MLVRAGKFLFNQLHVFRVAREKAMKNIKTGKNKGEKAESVYYPLYYIILDVAFLQSSFIFIFIFIYYLFYYYCFCCNAYNLYFNVLSMSLATNN